MVVVVVTVGAAGLGRLHRLAARADLDVAAPRRAGRGGAGAPRVPGSRQRAGPDRPRDARRAGPPHLPGLDARRAPWPSAPTSTRTRCAPAPTIIQDTAHAGAGRPARRARRAARPRDRRAARAAAADVRRPRRRWSRRSASAGLKVTYDDRLGDAGDRAARRDRPHRLPDRAGGHDQRRASTPRRTRCAIVVSGSPERRRHRRAAQPARVSAPAPRPGPGSGWWG